MSMETDANDEDCTMTENVDLPNIWYQCRYCSESCNNSTQLITHMESHDEDSPQDYTCKDCGSLFEARKDLWAHRQKNHNRTPDPSPCDMCKRVYFDKTEVYYHNMHAHTEADFLSKRSGGGSSSRIRESPSQKQNIFGASNSHNNSSIRGSNGSSVDGNNSFNEHQEYTCDMCPKTFTVLNALQVHRGWHLRGPDGRKVRDPADTWQPDQMPPSKMKKLANSSGIRTVPMPQIEQQSVPRIPVCPFCHAKFASGNNLRRHIVEVHKRNDARYMREAAGSPSVVVDKPKECSTCNMQFKTIAEWVDHKIQHARTIKPSSTFEWGCEICGKMFTRKERLLQHMITHLNSDFGGDASISNTNDNTEDGDNSSQYDNQYENQYENHSSDNSNGGMEDSHMLEPDVKVTPNTEHQSQQQQQNQDDDQRGFGCELCQVFFKTAKELRKHVTEHFVNGGGNAVSQDSRSQNQSSSASSGDESGSTQESGRTHQQLTPQEHQAFAAISQEYKCRICGSSCQDQLEMMTCMGSHQIPTPLKCGECQLFFANSKQVIDHEALYHPKGYI